MSSLSVGDSDSSDRVELFKIVICVNEITRTCEDAAATYRIKGIWKPSVDYDKAPTGFIQQVL